MREKTGEHMMASFCLGLFTTEKGRNVNLKTLNWSVMFNLNPPANIHLSAPLCPKYTSTVLPEFCFPQRHSRGAWKEYHSAVDMTNIEWGLENVP